MYAAGDRLEVAPAGEDGQPQIIDRFSIEMTARDLDNLREAKASLREGTTVCVTFLDGETSAARVIAATEVRRLGFIPKPHISARRLTSIADLESFLSDLAAQAAPDRAFVVAGDAAEPIGPFQDALAVIRTGLLSKYGIGHVGISGYPEGHPALPEVALWQALRDKRQALSDLGHSYDITTQFAFDADPVLDWLKRLRDEGFAAPVRIGVPGPASVKTLLRFAARCGVGASAKVMAKYGLSITRLLATAGPDALVAELAGRIDPAEHGEVFLHLYPFGGLRKTAEWVRDFSIGPSGR